ncbi:hypothetical protein Sjap_007657 [Stephania japonica]|uniref:F-box domain-containing protein n=1 Tax=Stephania japonica TaxID=461633 RepID=A0AAP0PA58_9MAGN
MSCISQLPDEVLASEILVKPPVKSLGRFKSVCKAWRAMISNHDFTYMHLSHHQSQSRASSDGNKQLTILYFAESQQLYTMTIKSTDETATAKAFQCDQVMSRVLERSTFRLMSSLMSRNYPGN